MVLRVLARHVTVDHHRLGGSLLADEEDRLPLLGDRVDEEVGADVVDVRDEDGRVLWGAVGRVAVFGDACVPVHPLTRQGT